LHLHNWFFLEIFPDGPILDARDLGALAVPHYMEHHLISKYKLKNMALR
jgi:hypothetical protein